MPDLTKHHIITCPPEEATMILAGLGQSANILGVKCELESVVPLAMRSDGEAAIVRVNDTGDVELPATFARRLVTGEPAAVTRMNRVLAAPWN